MASRNKVVDLPELFVACLEEEAENPAIQGMHKHGQFVGNVAQVIVGVGVDDVRVVLRV